MAVSLGPQGTLVTGTKTEPVTVTQHQRRVLWNCISDVLTNETRLFHVRLSTTRIRNGHQTTTVTTTSHRSCEITASLGPRGTLVTGTRTEPVTVDSIPETRAVNLHCRCLDEWAKFWGPPVSTGNGLLRYSLHCWYVCNGCSDWSPFLSDHCL
jgi:hypothetical protein